MPDSRKTGVSAIWMMWTTDPSITDVSVGGTTFPAFPVSPS